MMCAAEFRRAWREIVSGLGLLDGDRFCEVVGAVGRMVEGNMGAMWRGVMAWTLRKIGQQLVERRLSARQITMVVTGLKKMPIQNEI
jgi:hypothetical protein